MYSVNSIFLALLNLITNHQTGLVVLRSCVEPLWNDAEKIKAFYDDAEYNSTDPEYVGMDAAMLILAAMDSVGLVLPPPPDSVDDPLQLMPDGTSYADPEAAAAALAAAVAATKDNTEALAAVQAEPFKIESNIESVDEAPVAAEIGGVKSDE